MFEVRIHGRAGQGAKLAAQLLAEAALLEGKSTQAFPEYGPERSGAPVASYIRINDKEIRIHYPVVIPEAVLILDPTLIEAVDVNQGVKPQTFVIINTNKSAKEIKEKYKLLGKVYTIPASDIALKTIGANKPNTILLGFLIGLTNIVKLSSLEKIVERIFKEKNKPELVKSNLKAVREGYNLAMRH